MNGEPLPAEHGFPVRMVVPGLYGYVSATKWVAELEVTRFDRGARLLDRPRWSERARSSCSRASTFPREGQGLSAGETVIAGVAWQQHVGVEKVEVQIDGGAWQRGDARDRDLGRHLGAVEHPVDRRDRVDHVIRCRATSIRGETQTEDGACRPPTARPGWHGATSTVLRAAASVRGCRRVSRRARPSAARPPSRVSVARMTSGGAMRIV